MSAYCVNKFRQFCPRDKWSVDYDSVCIQLLIALYIISLCHALRSALPLTSGFMNLIASFYSARRLTAPHANTKPHLGQPLALATHGPATKRARAKAIGKWLASGPNIKVALALFECATKQKHAIPQMCIPC